MYRLGFRKGKKRGIEIGRQEGQHIEVTNRCIPCGRDIYPQIVNIVNCGPSQVWVCPNWQAHTIPTPHVQQVFPDVERFTDKLASTTTQQLPGAKLLNYLREKHSDEDAGPETKLHRAVQFPRQG